MLLVIQIRTSSMVRASPSSRNIILNMTALVEVISKRDQMDKGIHVGSWGQLQGTHTPHITISPSFSKPLTHTPSRIPTQNGRSTWTLQMTHTATCPTS